MQDAEGTSETSTMHHEREDWKNVQYDLYMVHSFEDAAGSISVITCPPDVNASSKMRIVTSTHYGNAGFEIPTHAAQIIWNFFVLIPSH